MKVRFLGRVFDLIVTNHARQSLATTKISQVQMKQTILTGVVKRKTAENKFWIYKRFKNREDNMICLSVATEGEYLIVVTALVNWRPHEDDL